MDKSPTQDKDRAYFLGEVHGHALRLEAAESTLIERERELGEARKELGWVRGREWSGCCFDLLGGVTISCILLSCHSFARLSPTGA